MCNHINVLGSDAAARDTATLALGDGLPHALAVGVGHGPGAHLHREYELQEWNGLDGIRMDWKNEWIGMNGLEWMDGIGLDWIGRMNGLE